MSITLDGTNGVTASSPATMKASAYLDAAGGNTATINGAIPAPATSPTLTTPIISGNLGVGGANYGTSGQVLTSGGAGASPSWATAGAPAYTSGQVTTAAGVATFAHGLGRLPYFVMGMLRCATASNGFSADQYIILTNDTYASTVGSTVYFDATNVYVGLAANVNVYGGTTLTYANFRTMVRAW